MERSLHPPLRQPWGMPPAPGQSFVPPPSSQASLGGLLGARTGVTVARSMWQGGQESLRGTDTPVAPQHKPTYAAWDLRIAQPSRERSVIMDGGTAIAQILRREGVDFIGCVPYQPLLQATAIAGIRPIIFRQEGTGIHMVDGYSRITNGHRIGVFMMQNGPGAENGFGGVAQAYAESVPILLLPAGMARQRRGVHPNFYPTRSYESITKWCAEINLVERVPELMRRAFAKLRSG